MLLMPWTRAPLPKSDLRRTDRTVILDWPTATDQARALGGTEMASTTDVYEEGLRIRREVLGSDHVDAALNRRNDFNEPFQRLITEYCWGRVWSRPELPRNVRSLI